MVNVSAGKNDPKSSIVCVYGNRLEGAVYAEKTPDKNIQKTVARDGVTEVIIQESCTLFKCDVFAKDGKVSLCRLEIG